MVGSDADIQDFFDKIIHMLLGCYSAVSDRRVLKLFASG